MENKNYKDYLNKTFLEELNYKIWTTKGSRFNANKRLKLISKMSHLANSILSFYLISIVLLSVYNIHSEEFINQNYLAYTVTCLSILILVFSQIEKSKEYHSCGIELSKIYNRLRVFKTLKDEPKIIEKEIFARNISEQYESILEKYDNHEEIDFSIFKTCYSEYFDLSLIKILQVKTKYYLKTCLLYHILIIFPPILILTILI